MIDRGLNSGNLLEDKDAKVELNNVTCEKNTPKIQVTPTI